MIVPIANVVSVASTPCVTYRFSTWITKSDDASPRTLASNDAKIISEKIMGRVLSREKSSVIAFIYSKSSSISPGIWDNTITAWF